MNKKIIKNKNGYYELKHKPTEEELSVYYENKYYQEGLGSYEKKYTAEEINYINNRQKYIEYSLKKINFNQFDNKNFLDIGFGEGWSLSHFNSIGCYVKGVDFSSFGIQKFNPDVLKYFVKGNIYEFIQNEIGKSRLWDLINLSNVIEHVIDPEKLLIDLKSLLSKNGIIICTFPNDFSDLQRLLIDKKKIDNNFWITIPDHISYFNKESFVKMASSLQFNIELILGDFPIDILLLNDHSNYVKDKSKGRQAHLTRVLTTNLINSLDFNSSAEIFIKLGGIGFGRNLTVFISSNT